MLKIDDQIYDDGTYYYLYVTDNGANGLTLEQRDGTVRKIADPKKKYLTLENDEYFNESLINEHLDSTIDAVKKLRKCILIVTRD